MPVKLVSVISLRAEMLFMFSSFMVLISSMRCGGNRCIDLVFMHWCHTAVGENVYHIPSGVSIRNMDLNWIHLAESVRRLKTENYLLVSFSVDTLLILSVGFPSLSLGQFCVQQWNMAQTLSELSKQGNAKE